MNEQAKEKIKAILKAEVGIPGLKVRQLQPKIISETIEEWRERVAGQILTDIEEDIEVCSECDGLGHTLLREEPGGKVIYRESCEECAGKGWRFR